MIFFAVKDLVVMVGDREVGEDGDGVGAHAEVRADAEIEQSSVASNQANRQREQAEDHVAGETAHHVAADERRHDREDHDDRCARYERCWHAPPGHRRTRECWRWARTMSSKMTRPNRISVSTDGLMPGMSWPNALNY